MNIIREIKIFFLKRKLVRLVGYSKSFDAKLKTWETIYLQRVRHRGYDDPSVARLEGNIKFYRERCHQWRLSAEICRTKLRKLGVAITI